MWIISLDKGEQSFTIEMVEIIANSSDHIMRALKIKGRREKIHMAYYVRNLGKPWTAEEEMRLRLLVRQNTPTRVIGLKLGRPVAGVRAKASERNISLKPTNQSPYNRKK